MVECFHDNEQEAKDKKPDLININSLNQICSAPVNPNQLFSLMRANRIPLLVITFYSLRWSSDLEDFNRFYLSKF